MQWPPTNATRPSSTTSLRWSRSFRRRCCGCASRGTSRRLQPASFICCWAAFPMPLRARRHRAARAPDARRARARSASASALAEHAFLPQEGLEVHRAFGRADRSSRTSKYAPFSNTSTAVAVDGGAERQPGQRRISASIGESHSTRSSGSRWRLIDQITAISSTTTPRPTNSTTPGSVTVPNPFIATPLAAPLFFLARASGAVRRPIRGRDSREHESRPAPRNVRCHAPARMTGDDVAAHPGSAAKCDVAGPAGHATLLRVLTLNAHQGFGARRRRGVLTTLRDALRASAADLVFLQEVGGDTDADAEHCEMLADEVWPQHAYGRNAVTGSGHQGNGLLSRYPIALWQNIDVSVGRAEPRGLLHCVVDIPHARGPLHTVCVHLGLREAHRRRQVDCLVDLIGRQVPPEALLVVAGDFNDWRGQVHRRLAAVHGLMEICTSRLGAPARTFPAWCPLLRLDRIYVRHVGTACCHCRGRRGRRSRITSRSPRKLRSERRDAGDRRRLQPPVARCRGGVVITSWRGPVPSWRRLLPARSTGSVLR